MLLFDRHKPTCALYKNTHFHTKQMEHKKILANYPTVTDAYIALLCRAHCIHTHIQKHTHIHTQHTQHNLCICDTASSPYPMTFRAQMEESQQAMHQTTSGMILPAKATPPHAKACFPSVSRLSLRSASICPFLKADPLPAFAISFPLLPPFLLFSSAI